MRGFNYKKAIQSLNFFAAKESGEINKMKALKLIWLSDKLHLIANGRLITGDSYYAMKNGPVASGTRDILEQNGFSLSPEELDYSTEFLELGGYDFTSKLPPVLKVLSKSDVDALEKVYSYYGAFPEFKLSDISHEFSEWKQYESALNKKVISRAPISTEDLFMAAPADQKLFDFDEDIVDFSREIYNSKKEVESIFK